MQDSNPCNLIEKNVADDRMNEESNEREEQSLLFLDSLDNYLKLLDSLSSTLRQGWLELASARHSMGSSRVSCTLLDLKVQSAATTVLLNEPVEGSLSVPQPYFTLSKWAYLEEGRSSPKKVIDGKLLKVHNSSELRHRGSKHVLVTREKAAASESTAVDANLRALSLSENSSATSKSTAVDENKQRYKALSVFGAFVPPKLRASQFSFETALETIVEIANAQSSMLSSFSKLQKDSKSSE